MTPIPNAVTFTDAERAALNGAGNPYPDEKLELPKEEGDGQSDGSRGETTTGDGGDGAGADKNQSDSGADRDDAESDKRDDEADGDDADEEVEVVNKEGETRRKMIAFGAYEKKRIEANKAKEELTKLREQVAYLSGLSQTAQQQAKPTQTQQQPAPQTEELSLTPPDKTKEPEKYLAWLEAAAAKALTIEQRTKAQTEQASHFQQLNQMVYEHEQAFVNGDEAAGIEAHPDFHDAVKFLQDKHRAELKEAGYERHEIEQIMAARAQDVSLRALKQGKSPAERVYQLAKVNGYKKAAPVVKETEAEKITRQAEKQAKAGKTISDMAGGESRGLTAEALANMDPKEFLKLWSSGEAKKVISWNQ